MSDTDAIQIWHNPRCSKSRGACALLAQAGIAADERRYLDDPPTREELERVLVLLGTDDPRILLRSGERRYAELGLGDAERDTLLDAMVANPILIERPVVIRGDRAVIARPPERVRELLG